MFNKSKFNEGNYINLVKSPLKLLFCLLVASLSSSKFIQTQESITNKLRPKMENQQLYAKFESLVDSLSSDLIKNGLSSDSTIVKTNLNSVSDDFYIESKNYGSDKIVVILPMHHETQDQDFFKNSLDVIRKYVIRFGIEGLAYDQSFNVAMSVPEIEKTELDEQRGKYVAGTAKGTLMNKIKECNFDVFGIEDKKVALKSELISQIYYFVESNRKNLSYFYENSTDEDIKTALENLNKQDMVSYYNCKIDEIINLVKDQVDDISDLEIAKLKPKHYDHFTEFLIDLMDINNNLLKLDNHYTYDVRTNTAAEHIKSELENNDIVGVVYGIGHIDNLIKSLEENQISYIKLGNYRIDEFIN